MIEIKNLTKKYGQNVVLDGINLNIKDGESIGILGANGAGKTTLVEIISGVSDFSNGEINFYNSENEKDNSLQEKIGMQFQSGSWPFNTRGVDLLNLFVGKNWKKDKYIENLLDIFEVTTIIKKRISYCSSGEQQRFNSMLSIINKPSVLILDELITGLDLKMQIKLINFFDKMRKNEKITLIVISHIPEEIEQICKRIVVLNKGTIFIDKTVNEIKKQYGSIRNFLTLYFEGKIND
ncbi:ABC transporter ATP-binding protein [Entomoplasma ellychniae]|uniref:ABC transporter ATP-binding protein n=2 Tax=Entomoplasmataceae TaxID=33925 RepID=A0A2S5RG65_9MOLU|nr:MULTISPECIES: ABC transporter ATP-binding protein [Entomoplasmataceae]PPE04518.1 ABC transporter ATP-binding protein [Entomoplasma ellychniae]PPE06291.1 ABC transporter ATP-binding protein [Mesoplasma corruscae]